MNVKFIMFSHTYVHVAYKSTQCRPMTLPPKPLLPTVVVLACVCTLHTGPSRLAASALCRDVCAAQAGATGPAASAHAFQGNFNYSSAAAAAAAATPNNREHFALGLLA